MAVGAIQQITKSVPNRVTLHSTSALLAELCLWQRFLNETWQKIKEQCQYYKYDCMRQYKNQRSQSFSLGTYKTRNETEWNQN